MGDGRGIKFFFQVTGYCLPVVIFVFITTVITILSHNIIWATLSALIIVAVLLTYSRYRVKAALRPVRELRRHLRIIGEGDFGQKLNIETMNELGTLGEAFNEIGDSLRNHIETELESAKERVNSKNLETLDRSAAKVTHRIGNFINNVGLATNALRSETLSPSGERVLDILEKESAGVREFIKEFHDFAKKPELHIKKSSIEKIIQDALLAYRLEADNRGIPIISDYPSDMPEIMVDPQLLTRVFHNLISNSLDIMNGFGRISIKGSIKNAGLQISIEDTGPGVEPDALPQIFDPFFTTNGKSGTGLGLAQAKSIITAHQGTIECRSESGIGTTFIISLPLQ